MAGKLTVGKNLKDLRRRLRLTQKQFAEKVPGNVDCTYIGKIERGDQWPSLKFLNRIAGTYRKDLSYFFQGGEELKALDRIELRGKRVKALACLISQFQWDLREFRECGSFCEHQPFCRKVKLLIQEKG